MCRSAPLVVASLAFVVALCNQLGSAEASSTASNVAAPLHNETQAGELGEKPASSDQGLSARRLADRLADERETAPKFGLYGGVPVSYDPLGRPKKLLITLENGNFFLEHPSTGQKMYLIVQHMEDVGLMFHDASTGNDLEWMLHHPHELKPEQIPKEQTEGDGKVRRRRDASSGRKGRRGEVTVKQPTRPDTGAVVFQPEVQQWTHEKNPEHPYVVFISGIPVKISRRTGEPQRVLFDVQRGSIVFIHPEFNLPMKLDLINSDLVSRDGSSPRELVKQIKEMGRYQ
ncbi:hypothetical protein, conserved [Eimeria maxima]|uniref:Uncharacterized protein n=1 Tax=Eimeria maxima TaxID=5804 RepID=U6MGN6_EIMMA|nr:hypothetical protein, conserved [Eimeria maxima]CDJ60810.1 hypothetical protein, conserved [Eimeria maxima]